MRQPEAQRVVLIDYGSGNLRSAAKAFERVSAGGAFITVTDSPEALKQATHIVLPGVGAFADCMRGLTSVRGMLAALEKQVLEARKPFLGVCVGMQMLFDTGHEHGEHAGLGWMGGEVVKISGQWSVVSDQKNEAPTTCHLPLATDHLPLKVPHMGWNDLHLTAPGHPLLHGIEDGDHAYFVHSYHAVCDEACVLATTDYGAPLTAIVAKGNIMGTQFHPEKSQRTGLKLIENFLSFSA